LTSPLLIRASVVNVCDAPTALKSDLVFGRIGRSWCLSRGR